MRSQRDKRFHADRTALIKSRYQEIEKLVIAYQRTHHPSEFFISTLDVCASPGVSESIVNPPDQVFQKCLTRIQDVISVTHALTLEERQGELLGLLPEGSKEDELGLAVSWFKCNCGQSFHYRRAIRHSCFAFHLFSYSTPEEIRAMEPLQQVNYLCGRGLWSVNQLAHWKEAAKLTKQVIEATGMDPKRVTPDELDAANHRFMVCAGGGSSTVTIVGWRCLVSYGFTTPSSSPTVTQRERGTGHRQVR